MSRLDDLELKCAAWPRDTVLVGDVSFADPELPSRVLIEANQQSRQAAVNLSRPSAVALRDWLTAWLDDSGDAAEDD